jgi:AraC family transcriptional regulator
MRNAASPRAHVSRIPTLQCRSRTWRSFDCRTLLVGAAEIDYSTDMAGEPLTSDWLMPGTFLAEPVQAVHAGSLILASWTAQIARPIERHAHASAHFMLVMSGRYHTTAVGDSCRDGDLLIFNPAGTEHDDQLETGGAFFTISLPSHGEADCRVKLPARPIKVRRPDALATARRLLRELAAWGPDSAFVAEGLSHALTASLTKSLEAKGAPGWLGDARRYLDEGYSEPLQLHEVASRAGVHPFHLTRTFRRFYGQTPGEYLRARRLERAAQALTQSSDRIAEIAVASGFSDQAHLTRRFRSGFGLSPAQYRRCTRS